MKIVLANTVSPLISRDEICSCEEMLMRCGRNTGNVCFTDAMLSQITFYEEIDCCNIAEYKEKAVFVLPASNWVNSDGWALHKVFLPLENSDVQLVVAGLGIQGDINESASDIANRLSKNTITALKILSEHSVSIGVRGEITATVLEKLGIYNCRVIGCPSFYEPFRHRKNGIDWKSDFDLNKVVCGITPGTAYIHKVLELAYKSQNTLVLQTMSDLPRTLLEGLDIEQRHIEDRFPGLKLQPHELKEYIQSKGKIFYTRKSWSEYLVEQGISFAWGSRFHGNMMAFSNGIPAVWIMHDARTKELIETMKLPYITKEKLLEIKFVEELFDICRYDDDFKESYRNLSLQYIDFLNENHVQHTFDI